MKKFLKSIVASILCVCTVFAFTACGVNYSKTTTNTDGIVSNGGVSLYKDGWLYFVNGTNSVSQANVSGKVVNGGIYRVKTDENGQILYETTQVDGKEVKSFKEIQPVVNRLVGYKYGSLNIFGDFLYYTTPSTERNKSGEMLTGKTEFRRYDFVTKKDQLIYTSKSSDDELTYGYVKQSGSLYLVVYEKNNSTLTSLLIGDKIKTAFVKKDVKSAIISESEGSVADGYVYYTLNYEDDAAVRRGVRVYKILPNGKGKCKLSEGKAVTLLTVKGGNLIYSYDSAIYSKTITDGDDALVFGANDVVCTKNYENIIFLSENEKLSVLVYEDEVLRLITWDNGVLTNQNLHEFDSGEKITFIGVEGDWVVYTSSNKVYKSRFKNITAENQDDKMPIQLSTTSLSDSDELMAPEIVNGYVYCFSKNSSTNKTYLYRISMEKPEEPEEAEFIGKAE